MEEIILAEHRFVVKKKDEEADAVFSEKLEAVEDRTAAREDEARVKAVLERLNIFRVASFRVSQSTSLFLVRLADNAPNVRVSLPC